MKFVICDVAPASDKSNAVVMRTLTPKKYETYEEAAADARQLLETRYLVAPQAATIHILGLAGRITSGMPPIIEERKE